MQEFLDRKGAFYNANEGDDDKNNEQQQLLEGFANSCYKIVSPILLQKLTIVPSTSTIVKYFYLLKMSATVLETRAAYFKRNHFF